MTASRDEAAQKAEAARTNSPGTCQLWTRTLYGAPSAGDQDHDGDADAVDGWLSEPVGARHVGDRNPPRGVPVAYSGGSHGYGHRAISLGGGKIRSTDAAGSGNVATVDLSWPERTWGLHYLGWSETIDGQPIPGGAPPPPAPHPRRHKQFVVDVSPRYQPGFNFQQAADEGIDAFVIKCTEGATVSYGSTFTIMLRAAQATGKPVAVYHWLHSTSSVAAQAAWLAAHIGDPTLPVMIDCERSSTPKLSHVLGFIAECKARRLRVSMLYLPRWYWSSDMGSPDLSDPALRGVALLNSAYGLNLPLLSPRAAYRANVSLGRWSPMGGKGVNLVQFGSRVKVAGMSVDCSVHRGQMSQLHHWFRTSAPPPPPPPPPVGTPQRVTVAAHNGQYGHKIADKRADIDELEGADRESIDVVVLSEWGSYGKAHPAADHDRYKGEGKPGQPSTPVDYRPSIFAPDTIDTTSVLLSGPARVPARIPGPADTKPKWGNQVVGVLSDAKVSVRFIPYHGNVRPHASKATKALRKEQVDALVQLVGERHARGEIVVLGGDFNCKSDDPETGGRLKAAGLMLANASALMQVWVTASEAVSIVGRRVIRDTTSDHDVPVVTFEFKP